MSPSTPLACIALAVWFPRAGAPEAQSVPAAGDRHNAAQSETNNPSSEPTQTPDVADESSPSDGLTARRWYGSDKTLTYSNGEAKATMHVMGTWDHKSCAGSGRSATGRKAIDNGGCLHGIELAMEHESGMFWIDQRVFAYRDRAAAKAASGLLETDRIAQDVTFRIPEIGAKQAAGNVKTFGRCMVIATVALDLDELKKLDEKTLKALMDQVSPVWTSTTVEPVNAFISAPARPPAAERGRRATRLVRLGSYDGSEANAGNRHGCSGTLREESRRR
jgi:hypothetical protein